RAGEGPARVIVGHRGDRITAGPEFVQVLPAGRLFALRRLSPAAKPPGEMPRSFGALAIRTDRPLVPRRGRSTARTGCCSRAHPWLGRQTRQENALTQLQLSQIQPGTRGPKSIASHVSFRPVPLRLRCYPVGVAVPQNSAWLIHFPTHRQYL